MTSDDLRRWNATLRDKIKQVLEMHPELRDETEAIALTQDLHVEVGAPFLERTRDKLLERARAMIERYPELEHSLMISPQRWLVRASPPAKGSSRPPSAQTRRSALRPSG
jgi:hypothetical protein